MTRFADLPIRRKLLVMTLISSATGLVLAASGFLAWDITQFRSEVQQDIDAQASIVAENSTAPLTFSDNRAAGETLAVLRLRSHVEVACLYAQNGSLFAAFHRDDAGTSCPQRPPPASGFDSRAYRAVTPVVLERQRVGTLFIERDLGDMYERLRVGLMAVAGLLLLAGVTALLVASRMQHSIAAPLLQLADTARAISAGHDYSLRATPLSSDEVGVVVHAFNDMLDRLAERNDDLSRANTDLAHEVEERRRVEVERTAALDRERDANRLKDEFLATLSHELRTPLNAVLGWARMLRAAPVEPQVRARAMDSIERNALAQARLIEDLLEISRIVTGKLRIRVQDVDLAAIVDAAVEVVQPAAAARRITLSTDGIQRSAPSSGDPDRLQQIVWNMLSNAVKFTPEGGAVSVRLEGGAGSGYRISVSDTGQGIDTRFLPHVFEPFRQADGTTSREHGGLGLGLAIARQLVELHGGTIEAHSDGRGKGATFEVYLPSVVQPLASAASTTPPAEASRPALDGKFLTGLRLLVVDDEEDARLLFETSLQQYGAEVKTAASAEEAFAALGGQCPDVLISDIGMPREDGYSLIKRIRSSNPAACASVPAIAVTAYASAHDREEALAAGFQAHIAKPFDPEMVARLIAQLARHLPTTDLTRA